MSKLNLTTGEVYYAEFQVDITRRKVIFRFHKESGRHICYSAGIIENIDNPKIYPPRCDYFDYIINRNILENVRPATELEILQLKRLESLKTVNAPALAFV